MTIDRRAVVATAGFATLMVAFTPAALAQDARPGRVSTRGFAKLPSPLVVELRALDNSDENLRLAAEIRRRLERAGHRVVERGAAVRLDFESEVRSLVGEGSRPPRGAASAPDAVRGPQESRPDALPSESTLRRRPGASTPSSRALRYVINATIDDVATGRRLWQGNVRYDDAEAERQRILLRLVPELLRDLGRTVQARRFVLE